MSEIAHLEEQIRVRGRLMTQGVGRILASSVRASAAMPMPSETNQAQHLIGAGETEEHSEAVTILMRMRQRHLAVCAPEGRA